MSSRDRLVVMVVGCLAAVAAAWFFVVSPKREEAARLADQVAAAQSSLDAATAAASSARAAASQYRTSYAQLARIGQAIPNDDQVGTLLVELQGAAGRSRVDFRGLQLSASGSSASSPAAAVAATAATTAAAAANAASALPPGATVGPTGLPTMPFVFTFQGTYFGLTDFIGRVQRFVVADPNALNVSGRLLAFNSINLAAGSGGFPQIVATINATAYLAPRDGGLTTGASPLGAAPQTVATPSAAVPATGAAVPATGAVPAAASPPAGAAVPATAAAGSVPAPTTVSTVR